MGYCIAFDGGGTKSCAILFDESGPVAFGRSGGTNTNFTTLEDCRQNIAECLDQVFAQIENPVVEALYAVIVGPFRILEEELKARAYVDRIITFGEGQAGILAGALQPAGIVAMSGTGSDAFYTAPDGRQSLVGAYGSILGDDGSGVWIGQQALRKAIAYGEGWGEPTIIRELIYTEWKLKRRFDIVAAVHGGVAPFRKVASAVPIVAEAARMGDVVALSIFREAGRLMATQTLALIRREPIAENARLCVCCGGAWKAHPAMYEAFEAEMCAGAPDIRVTKPLFEHVMAGVVKRFIERHPNAKKPEIRAALEGMYREYKVAW